jgi:flagellar biosynthesis component FlhA
VPSIRLRDNVQLNSNEYVLKIKGVEIARGEVMADHFLAINAAGTKETISGIETVDPAFRTARPLDYQEHAGKGRTVRIYDHRPALRHPPRILRN